MVENFCSSRFKNQTTEELVETFGKFKGMENFTLKYAIMQEVFARFSERMYQMGMKDFMVDLMEHAQRREDLMRRKLVKKVKFGIKPTHGCIIR
jgi:hypothetical protein